MSSVAFKDPKKICEKILKDEVRYNQENSLLPSETEIAERLLARGLELNGAYEELQGKLGNHPRALQTFLGIVLNTAAFWSPEKIAKARIARDQLADVNRQIGEGASNLAELLRRRSTLHNTTGFGSETHYHVCEVLKLAGKSNHRFTSYVQLHLDALRAQYDLKYWPELSDFLQEIARDAEMAETQALDPLTAAATAASRSSLADFVKALLAAIAEQGAEQYGPLPSGLVVSDSTIASLTNCALNHGPEELVDGPYVKRLRQRERDAENRL
ncbi:MAG: hypothetical protein V4542_13915 [Pseudomonadota bacterium]